MTRSQQHLDHLATQVFHRLEQGGDVLVLAESCTAGLIAATLARVPGMSRRLAGSFVVYQIDSKVAWLGVSADVIQQHDVVSREVAASMAAQALDRTPHATISLAITGHLGPDAPREVNGIAWLAIGRRGPEVVTMQLRLIPDAASTTFTTENACRIRHARQADAVRQALSRLLEAILQCRK